MLEYIWLYEEHEKGANKYSRFYLSWYGQAHGSACTAIALVHEDLKAAYDSDVSTDTWDTIVSSVLYVAFNYLQKNVAQYVGTLDAPDMSTDVSAIRPVTDDDVSLLRCSGWALFSAVSYRKRDIAGKTKIHHTSTKLSSFSAELDVLQSLVRKDKSGLPVAITARDRGQMTSPCDALMPFLKTANAAFTFLPLVMQNMVPNYLK